MIFWFIFFSKNSRNKKFGINSSSASQSHCRIFFLLKRSDPNSNVERICYDHIYSSENFGPIFQIKWLYVAFKSETKKKNRLKELKRKIHNM